MVQKIQGAQRDFSFGEIDVALKRSDEHPARKAGLRQMSNARILNSGAVQNRSGRSALYPITGGCTRIEELTLSAGNVFKIEFGPALWQIRNAAGTVVAQSTTQGNGAALPWTGANANLIGYAVLGLSIYMTFGHSMRPQVITWDGVSVWTFADYTELLFGGQKRTPFYRISAQGITIVPGGLTGSVGLLASAAVFTAAHVGTRLRFINRQMLITAVADSEHATVTIEETLPGSQVIEFLSNPNSTFSIGDVVIGSVSGSRGQITALGSLTITVQLLTNSTSTVITTAGALTQAFITTDIVVGPAGSLAANVVDVVNNPAAVTDWDDEIMNDFRGYPASVFVDQFRLGFTDFPSVPGGILWSAINSPIDAYANDASSPDNAIFEIAPGKAQVHYVIPGPEGSEFVFCDVAIYYIPISTSNPLVPGSVGFTLLSGDGAAKVQPRLAQQAILYANAGQNGVMAVIATGSLTQPFNTKMLSEFHQHLFSNIQCIAAPNADGTFLERYAYVLNGNGSIVVGRYQPESLLGNLPVIGWGPWSGGATVEWIAAWNADVLFTSTYFGIGICEILDDTQYLDSAISVNNPPAAFTAAKPASMGPLWFVAGQSVALMDQVTRAMGVYQIDVNGNIIPQNNGGENLAIVSLVAGQPWTGIIEPFCPDASPGADVAQRMMKRRVARFAAYVENSTGFLMARLFSGPITPTSQAKSIPLGTIMNTRRVTTFNQGDNPTLPPPLREEAQRWRPLGRSFDPRVAIIKDTPGPLLIAELGMEATI